MLHHAAQFGDSKTIGILVTADQISLDPTCEDNRGRTLMMLLIKFVIVMYGKPRGGPEGLNCV